MAQNASPTSVVTLDFCSGPAAADVLRGDLSACELTGSCLWLGCDEATTVERLITRDGVRFAEHRAFSLGRIFDLPAGNAQEIDIEGLAHDAGYLWITGSHSLKRKKPRRHEKDPGEALRRLSVVEADPNRYFLARLPLVPGEERGIHDLARSGIAGASAACLPMESGTNALAEALAADPLLGQFVHIPCKENGLDVEGIAARDDHVFLGLRGPVLRGWATILEVEVRGEGSGLLALNAIGPRGEAYRSHLLDLDGLGVRDLALDGDDLVILAGPTMDLDGPSRIYRWTGALGAGTSEIITHDRLDHLLDVPYGDGVDHAEGLALIEGACHAWNRDTPSRIISIGQRSHKSRLKAIGITACATTPSRGRSHGCPSHAAAKFEPPMPPPLPPSKPLHLKEPILASGSEFNRQPGQFYLGGYSLPAKPDNLGARRYSPQRH